MRRKRSTGFIVAIIVVVLCLVLTALIPAFRGATDPHAGHNHAPGETHTTVDPHAGHNHD